MKLLAEVTLDDTGIFAQIEKTRKVLAKSKMELDELEDMLRKATLKEVGDSEESPKGQSSSRSS